MSDKITAADVPEAHSRSCPCLNPVSDDFCTCALAERKTIATLERQLREAREENARLKAPVSDARVQNFWDTHALWSQQTFGSDAERGPIGPLKHLEKEACDCQDAPDDLEEKADCLLLIFDATRRSGRTLAELMEAAEAKLEKNKKREWSRSLLPDEPIEHRR
jgi:hypothetical protein